MKERLNELLACFEKELIESSFDSMKQYLDECDAAGLDNLVNILSGLQEQLYHLDGQISGMKTVANYTIKRIKEGD